MTGGAPEHLILREFGEFLRERGLIDGYEIENGSLLISSMGVMEWVHFRFTPADSEPSQYALELVEVGEKKIQVIKAIRAAAAIGLKEAKDIVDSAGGYWFDGTFHPAATGVAIIRGLGPEAFVHLTKDLDAAGCTYRQANRPETKLAAQIASHLARPALRNIVEELEEP